MTTITTSPSVLRTILESPAVHVEIRQLCELGAEVGCDHTAQATACSKVAIVSLDDTTSFVPDPEIGICELWALIDWTVTTDAGAIIIGGVAWTALESHADIADPLAQLQLAALR